MPSTTSNRNANTRSRESRETGTPREITRDVVDYLSEYARQKPGYAALTCIAIGFVLGWKLKPW